MSIDIIQRSWTLRICLLIVLIGPLRAWPTRDPDAITFPDDNEYTRIGIEREDKKIRGSADAQNHFYDGKDTNFDGKDTNVDKDKIEDGLQTDIRFIIGAPYRWACPPCERRDHQMRCRRVSPCKEDP
ncbi:hypothetical protein TKK_0013391 [Trichogramma kaykai]|uniref:Secreted protein n=1 Tax=Trichogramma kaykai TaxID=54128 RepID=A0ABD2WHY7_9HYME